MELPDPNEIAEAFAAAVRERLARCIVPTPPGDTLPQAPPIPAGTRYYLAATGKLMPPGTEPPFPSRKLIYGALKCQLYTGCRPCAKSDTRLHYDEYLNENYALDNYGGLLFPGFYIVRSLEPLPPLHLRLTSAFGPIHKYAWNGTPPPTAATISVCLVNRNGQSINLAGSDWEAAHPTCAAWKAAHPKESDPLAEKHLGLIAEAANEAYSPIENYLRALAQSACQQDLPVYDNAASSQAYVEMLAASQARDIILCELRSMSARVLDENADLHVRLAAQQAESGELKVKLRQTTLRLGEAELKLKAIEGPEPEEKESRPSPLRELHELRAKIGGDHHLDAEVSRARTAMLEKELDSQRATYAQLTADHGAVNRRMQTALAQATAAEAAKEEAIRAQASKVAGLEARAGALEAENRELRSQLRAANEQPASSRDATIVAMQRRADDAGQQARVASEQLKAAKAELAGLQSKFASLQAVLGPMLAPSKS